MHQRYYSNQLARFVSVDPVGGSVGSSQSTNRYSYVLGNPINWVDPFGLATQDPDDPYTWHDEIQVTGDEVSFLLVAHRRRESDRKSRNKQVDDRMQRVLEKAFVEPKLPCVESYATLYRNSWNKTHGAGYSLLSWQPHDRLPRFDLGLNNLFETPSRWVGVTASSKAFGGPGPLKFALSGLQGATMGGAAFTALETGIVVGGVWVGGMVASTFVYEGGVAVGTAINAYLGEPCTRVQQ